MAAGCGPSLRFVDPRPEALLVDGACSQGPFVIQRATLGARWGEQFEVRVVSQRPIAARLDLHVGEQRVQARSFWTQHDVHAERGASRSVADRRIDNARCLERPGALVVASSSTAAQAPGPPLAAPPRSVPAGPPEPEPAGPPVPVAAEPPEPEPVATPASEPPPPPDETHAPARLVPTHASGGRHYAHLVTWRVAVERLEGAGVEAGQPIRLRVWSDEPIDWSSTVFIVSQAAAEPSVPEAEWIAHLEAERAEAEREAAARAKAQERRRAERAAELARRAAKRRARAEHCRTHHEDEGCWGKGGYEGWRARQHAANARRRAEYEAALAKARAQAAARAAERARATADAPPPTAAPATPAAPAALAAPAPPEVVEVAAPAPPRVCRPDGPPPPAPVEVSSPRPTPHASWVAGYYAHSCEGWFWLEGWWKVPERDLRAEVAVRAPSAPPPLQVEVRPPCPIVGAVWIEGAWVWSAGAWIWVHGRWALPPSRGASWRPTVWIRLPGGAVRLDPGRWELRIGR